MRILLFYIFLFGFTDLSAQTSIPSKQIDSLFRKIKHSESDWVISLSIEQAGTIPSFDSLGNLISKGYDGTYILFKIEESYFLQKLWYKYLEEPYNSKIVFGKRIKIDKSLDLKYTVDSILLVEKEWIYPYIYKEKSVDAYNIQEPADHEPYYGMYFKVMKKDGQRKYFTETSLSEAKIFIPYKNLNYIYNTHTFIYRSFYKILSLIKQNMKVLSEQ